MRCDCPEGLCVSWIPIDRCREAQLNDAARWREMVHVARPDASPEGVERAVRSILKDPAGSYAQEIEATATRNRSWQLDNPEQHEAIFRELCDRLVEEGNWAAYEGGRADRLAQEVEYLEGVLIRIASTPTKSSSNEAHDMARLAVLAADCPCTSWSGTDDTPLDDPEKPWRCDECGRKHNRHGLFR